MSIEDRNKLPKGWAAAPLNEAVQINPRSLDKTPDDDDLVSFVPMKAVEEWSGRLDASETKTWREATSKTYTIFQEGDVLFAKITPCMENGKYAIAEGLHNGVGVGSTEFHIFRPTKALNTKYLLHQLFSDRFRHLAILNMRGAAGQLRVPTSFLEEVEIPLAPIAEQHRIVAEIEKQFARLDECTAALRRVADDLKQYRASVLKAACEGRLVPTEAELARAEGRDYEPASVLLERILAERRDRWEADQLARMKAQGKTPKDEKWKEKYEEPEEPGSTVLLPELEEGWAFATIDQISIRSQYGTSAKTRSEPDGVPVIRMGNIVDGKLELNDLKYLPTSHEEFPDLLLDPGDLLFNRTNSAELVGKTAVYEGNPSPCSFASYLIRVSFIEGIMSEFINFFLNSIYGRAWISSVVSQQVGQANVNGTKLKALIFPLPPLPEQRRIVAEVGRRMHIVDELEELVRINLERANELRRSILKRAFEGRLAPQDPNDEPAASLLERIVAERQRRAEEAMTQKKSPSDKRRKKSPETEPAIPLFAEEDLATQPKELLAAFAANERLTVEDLFRHGGYSFDSEADIDAFFEKLNTELEAARLTLERADNDDVFVARSAA